MNKYKIMYIVGALVDWTIMAFLTVHEWSDLYCNGKWCYPVFILSGAAGGIKLWLDLVYDIAIDEDNQNEEGREIVYESISKRQSDKTRSLCKS